VTAPTTPAPAAKPAVKRRPIRGILGGISLGLGLAMLLVVSSTIALGTLTPLIVIVVCAMAGVSFAMFAPPLRTSKKGRATTPVGPPSSATTPGPPTSPPSGPAGSSAPPPGPPKGPTPG
jgi:predicted lipid-binding transport protein (Tim44 family)